MEPDNKGAEEGLMGLLNAFGFDSQRTGSVSASSGPKATSPKATGADINGSHTLHFY
jgi:hypothetical protein